MQTGAAYVRVSTEDQIEFSPDSQIKKIQEYADNHRIWLPEKFIFMDEGISGRTAKKRPAFMQMIGTAKQKPKPFDVILLWKFSRFARNRQDSILYKSMLRKECGIDVISITEQLSDDPTAILIEALLEAMDEYYSINLAQEVRRGMNEKFSRGGVVSTPPFGYKMGTNHFEIDEDTAPFVCMMYEDFRNGISYRQIAAKLNNMGVRSNRGNLFENRTVAYILSNPVYLGKQRRHSSGNNRKDRFLRGEDVDIVNAMHEPIITEELFSAVQIRIADVEKSHAKSSRTSYTDFMLRGLVRCSSCGSTLIQSVKGKSLQCHKYAKGQCRESHSISIEKLNRTVIQKLTEDLEHKTDFTSFSSENTFHPSPEYPTINTLEIHISNTSYPSTSSIHQSLLEREYKRVERIKAAYEAGIDNLDEYRQKKMSVLHHIQSLEQELKKTTLPVKFCSDSFRKPLPEIVSNLLSPEITETTKNEMLRSFISKIVFNRKDSSIQIYYYV